MIPATSQETINSFRSHLIKVQVDDAGWFTASELICLDWALPDAPAVDLVIKELLQTS
jgi:hypothetical protein